MTQEHEEITADDVGTLDANVDPFASAKPLPGEAAVLGRAIVDEQGMPSGSPANYEATRGKTGREADPAEIAEAVDALDVASIMGVPATITDDDEE